MNVKASNVRFQIGNLVEFAGREIEVELMLRALPNEDLFQHVLTMDASLKINNRVFYMSISVKDKVLNIIAEQAMLETSDISLNMSVEDLGLDSLGLVEAIFSIEETFSVNVPFNANDPNASEFDISSVGSIVDAINKLVMEKSN